MTYFKIVFLVIFVILYFTNFSHANARGSETFDRDLYERVLDPELCDEQLQAINEDPEAILIFYDSGIRLPRGILAGNLADWGNYHQCLSIRYPMQSSIIEGKYCAIQVPFQDVSLNNLPTLHDNLPKIGKISNKTINLLKQYEEAKSQLQFLVDTRDTKRSTTNALSSLSFMLGICIPKVCSTSQAIQFLVGNSAVDMYRENYCRLPDDKPFVAADYVAIAIFSLIGGLLILSTGYDLYHTFILKKDPQEANTLLCSFSAFTNTRRLLTFNSAADTLHCVDGIRSLSIFWIILGHSISTSANVYANPLQTLEMITSISSVWLKSAPITVDTFFMLSGLLIVYTTAGKLSSIKFLRQIHLFYILRYLRLFPILATVILFQASIVHHMSDGPTWHTVASQVEDCRQYWWSPLVYVQNYVNPSNPCIAIAWYLCIDMQLHWISPLVLVWVLRENRKMAWFALTMGLFASLLVGSIYSFLMNFPSFSINIEPYERMITYMQKYYINTLTRASPFFVGMMFGYILHLDRGRKEKLSAALVTLLWALCIAASSFAIFITQPISQADYENQLFDNFLNSFMRPLWACALGWLIFACAHGYAGPVNWFLSLQLWKLPARLSYAMYLFHYPLMYLVQGSLVSPLYFSVAGSIFKFFADLAFVMIVSLIATLAVDSPCSTLQKLLIGGHKPQRHELKNVSLVQEASSSNSPKIVKAENEKSTE